MSRDYGLPGQTDRAGNFERVLPGASQIEGIAHRANFLVAGFLVK